MTEDIARVLLDEAALAGRVAELAAQISADYAGTCPVLVGGLKGSFIFLADLVRRMELPVCIDFVRAQSYGEAAVSAGAVQLELDLCGELVGREVLVVEDIIDTGRTLAALVEALRATGARSVRTCCLLDKPSRRVSPISPDYVGFAIPDEFVVGYGLDFAERYRQLPYVAVLKREAYEASSVCSVTSAEKPGVSGSGD